MWNTRACEIPTNLHGQLVRLYREVMLEHDSSWLGIQFILGSSYTAICATATWPCMSKPSRSKRRRRATWAKTGCWSKPTQPATWTCRLIRPSGQWAPSTSLAFPFHFLANLRQFSTAPNLSVQKFRTQCNGRLSAGWCSLLRIPPMDSRFLICQASIPFRAKTKPEASAIPNRACSRTQ